MNESDLSLETLLQETLVFTEYIRANNLASIPLKPLDQSFYDDQQNEKLHIDDDYLYDIADSLISENPIIHDQVKRAASLEPFTQTRVLPEGPGVIYKIDNASSTFCVRGYTAHNIREAFNELNALDSSKRIILKLDLEDKLTSVEFFETKSFELAFAVCEQVLNRRFPHQEDSVCNISDPGFSWWMNIDQPESKDQGRFEIFFRSHGINRADKYIQLGPIGDGSIAALRMNQARSLLRSSFPISEFSCDDKSFTVASLKPDHLSFLSFKNIFIEGSNHTELENFPDNGVGRTLFYYFQELACVRKFWIEVKTKLG
jgi:hypothetical protein